MSALQSAVKRLLFIVVLVVIGACVPARAPSSVPTDTVRATATPTPAPTVLPRGSGAESGEVLFRTTMTQAGFACATCHYPNSEERLIGPGLRGVSQRVAAYDLELSVEAYLLESILEPDAFLVPAQPPYPARLMPHNYAEIFSEVELADLVEYLLTL